MQNFAKADADDFQKNSRDFVARRYISGNFHEASISFPDMSHIVEK